MASIAGQPELALPSFRKAGKQDKACVNQGPGTATTYAAQKTDSTINPDGIKHRRFQIVN